MTGVVANIVIHSNQMWMDLRYFYIMVKAFEKNENQKN